MRSWALVVVVVACGRASDDRDKLQDQPPPKQVDVPSGLAIAVDVDGAARPPITSDQLRTTKPDFADAERRAWLVTTLVADASAPRTTIEATAPSAVSIKFAR